MSKREAERFRAVVEKLALNPSANDRIGLADHLIYPLAHQGVITVRVASSDTRPGDRTYIERGRIGAAAPDSRTSPWWLSCD